MAQSIFSNLKIIIHDGYEAELQFNNSSGQTLNMLTLYMNDRILCHVKIFDEYFNSDIDNVGRVLTPIIGTTATAMIRVNGISNKTTATIDSDGNMDFVLEIPHVTTYTEEGVKGEFQILIKDLNGDKIHTPIIDLNIKKPIGNIKTAINNREALEKYLKEKTRKEYEILPSKLVKNDMDMYEIILKHSIKSCDGNIFVSVLGEDKMDRPFTKIKVSDNELKIIVKNKEKLYIALRK